MPVPFTRLSRAIDGEVVISQLPTDCLVARTGKTVEPPLFVGEYCVGGMGMGLALGRTSAGPIAQADAMATTRP